MLKNKIGQNYTIKVHAQIGDQFELPSHANDGACFFQFLFEGAGL